MQSAATRQRATNKKHIFFIFMGTSSVHDFYPLSIVSYFLAFVKDKNQVPWHLSSKNGVRASERR
jgi:hypothetical protein